MNEPALKMLLGIRKEYLVIKAKNYGLDPTGVKFELAKRIADHEEKISQREWKAISTPSR